MILPVFLFISFLSLIDGYDEADLVFVGDAMQHQAQIDAARTGKTYSYDGCFDLIRPYVSSADYAVVNLETPVSAPPHSGYPCFNAPPEYIDALRAAGFDLFLTANNHTLDRRSKGLRATIDHLDSRKLDHTGTYLNDSSRTAGVPLIKDLNNIKTAFLNYTYGTNGIRPDGEVVVDYIDRDLIKNDVQDAREKGAEIVCVCIHWGDEYKLLPNRDQKLTADFLEAIGVDMIIGAHPHVIQPFELRPNRYYPDRNVLIAYSLGNFISNMKTPDTRGGAMLHVKLFRGEDRKPIVKEASYRLLFTVPGTRPDDNFKVMPLDSVKSPLWKQRADEFNRRATKIFDSHNIGVALTQSPI